MSDLEGNIKNFSIKLQQLLKQYRSLQKENEQLNIELKEIKKNYAQKITQTDQLQQQVAILKTSAGFMNEHDKKAFEKNINLYIKEIDKCIALLSE
jgi:regulator of replication initiation timing